MGGTVTAITANTAQPTAPAPAPSRLPEKLPPLRENLRLHAAAPNHDGSPAWVIQDPISNVFFRIGWLEFELLVRWHLQSVPALIEAVSRETLLHPTPHEIEDLYAFLLQNQLLEIHDLKHTRELVARQRRQAGRRLKWLVHNYLFFRVPIIRPAQALSRMLPWLNWIFAPMTGLVVVGLSMLGLVLTARQWDVFVASFMETLSPTGLIGYLFAIAVAKSLHELGHALTATRYGLRVSHMGVAFIVLWPMLYTDTGEAWRLPSRRQRLAIDSAGILTELGIAGLATLAWHLAADGDLKQALFYLATTSWVLTLGLNASPFMRFDGYFILSDALELPNLHERAFSVARVAIRNTLFGWNDPDPEAFSPGLRRGLIIFALMTWLYRLVLFIGIAIAVYLFFFKLLGIVLFAVEIVWFIVLPIWRELKVWVERRQEITAMRKVGLITGLVLPVVALALPWPWLIHGEAVAYPAQTQVLYSPIPARIVALRANGENIEQGEVLFELHQPELAYRSDVAHVQVEAMNAQLRGLSGVLDGEERRAAMERIKAVHTSEWSAQNEERERLSLRAPFAGHLTDLDPLLAHGVWVNPRDPLAVLIDPDQWQLEVYVDQVQLAAIEIGANVRFYPHGEPDRKLLGTVTSIESVRTSFLPYEMLSTEHGGNIPVIMDASGKVPRDALYRVRVKLTDVPGVLRLQSGRAVIEGTPRSVLLNWLRPALVVLIREMSF